MTEMPGVYCGNRPMRISTPAPRGKSASGGPFMPGAPSPVGMYSMGALIMGYHGAQQPKNQFTHPNNTPAFIGRLSRYLMGDELCSFFEGFGGINYVKIPPGKVVDLFSMSGEMRLRWQSTRCKDISLGLEG